jgi:ABC-type multidrug transport system fused ATPase/permease subunit
MTAGPPLSARTAFRRFWPYVRPDRRLLCFATALLIVSAAAETTAIWTFGDIADNALAKASLIGFWLPAAIWVAMAATGGLASFGAGRLTAIVAERFLLRLRDNTYAHLQRLSPDFFARHDTGDLVARLTSDVDMVEQLAASGIVTAVSAVITVLFFATAATIVCWQLAVAAILLAPVFWLVARTFATRTKTVSREERDHDGAITAAVQESLTNLTLVQAYNRQLAEQHRLHSHGTSWLRTRIREARLAGMYTPLVDIAEITCLLLVIGAGIWEVGNGRLTIGGGRLSGGQRQRLSIARALLRNTPVLVLDEPTAGLDAPATQRVIDPLRQLAGGRTTLLISHDLSLAPLADRILVLDHGRLVEQGAHRDLMLAGGPYSRLHAGDRPRRPEPVALPEPPPPARPIPVTRPRLTPIHLHGNDTGQWLLRGNLR